MSTFWEIVASNVVVATILAIGALLLGTIWKNAAALHVLWLVVLLKLFTPPLLTAELPFASRIVPSVTSADGLKELQTHPQTMTLVHRSRVAIPNDHGVKAGGDQQHALGSRHAEAAGREPWSLAFILAAIWICGACCMAVGYAVHIRRFASVIRNFEVAPPAIRSMVALLSSRLGLGASARCSDDVQCSAAACLVDWTLPTRDFAFRALCPHEQRSSRHDSCPRTRPYPARRPSCSAARARGDHGLLVASCRVVRMPALART